MSYRPTMPEILKMISVAIGSLKVEDISSDDRNEAKRILMILIKDHAMPVPDGILSDVTNAFDGKFVFPKQAAFAISFFEGFQGIMSQRRKRMRES